MSDALLPPVLINQLPANPNPQGTDLIEIQKPTPLGGGNGNSYMQTVSQLLANIFTGLAQYPNDAAAAAGGVEVGQAYLNGSVLQVRVS